MKRSASSRRTKRSRESPSGAPGREAVVNDGVHLASRHDPTLDAGEPNCGLRSFSERRRHRRGSIDHAVTASDRLNRV
jgi:hypothetical protein